MMKSFVVVAAFLTLSMACSKKDAPIKLSKEFLLGKWNYTFFSFKKTVDNTVERNVIYKDVDLIGSYNDFRANDTLYSLFMGEYDTSHYSISKDITGEIDRIIFAHKGESKVEIFNITQISNNQLTMYKNIVDQGLPPAPKIGYEAKNILSR